MTLFQSRSKTLDCVKSPSRKKKLKSKAAVPMDQVKLINEEDSMKKKRKGGKLDEKESGDVKKDLQVTFVTPGAKEKQALMPLQEEVEVKVRLRHFFLIFIVYRDGKFGYQMC